MSTGYLTSTGRTAIVPVGVDPHARRLVVLLAKDQADVVHVVESLAVKTTDDVHHVLVDHSSMKGSGLGRVTTGFNLGEPALLNVELVDVVEPLLVRVHASEDVDVGATNDGRVPVSGLRRRAERPVDLVPVVGQETVLDDVVHRVVPVPASEHKHGVLVDDCGVTEPVERLGSFGVDLFPLVLLVS